MTQFDDHASVHPKSVTEVSRREDPKLIRRSNGPRKPRVITETTQVNPLAWEAALRCCDGDTRRIEIINAGEILIHNDPHWRKNRRT